jgi:hypothetical protein
MIKASETHKILYLSILLLLLVSSLPAQEPLTITKLTFANPPRQFYPAPFWHINGEMTNEGIVQQMTDARLKANFNGVAVLPVGNTLPEFLSEAYFNKYELILETARKLNVNVILYDDTGFPSGSAGGQLEMQFPDDVRKTLEKSEVVRTGPSFWKSPLPAGKLMAAVAMNTETHERIDLRSFINAHQILNWHVPKGEWRIMFFTCNTATFWKSYFPVDYLDTTAVRHFMSLTYDIYAERFSRYFKNTIQLTFFDDVGFLRTERAWTNAFNEKFIEVNRFDPAVYYPALWYNIGPETEAARVAFFNTRSELMAEGFPKMVTEWTKKYGLKNTGHPPGNYAIQPVDMSGDIFKFYRYTDLPLADLIIEYGRGRDGFKLISSASDLYDRPVTATEIYGALKEDVVDSLMLYRALMEIQARGINFVIPHGMWYNPSKVSIPPLVSPFSEKLSPGLPAYSDYVGRTCYLLQGGRRVSDIALLYPISSLQGGFCFDSPDNKRAGTWAYPEADYLRISDMLTNEIRRDFTFVHPEYLATGKYLIQKSRLHLDNKENFQDYKLIIIPGGKVISAEALRKIKLFYDAGGKVIATTLLPSLSAEMGKDLEIAKMVIEIFGPDAHSNPQVQTNDQGGKALFIPEPSITTLSEVFASFTPEADVLFEDNPLTTSQLGVFSYLHKVRDGKNIYFFANSGDNEISTNVLLRGKLSLDNWNPHSGEVTRLNKVSYIRINGHTYTRCKLNLEGVHSTFWIGQ